MIDSKVKKLSASAPRPVANYKEDITAAEIKISLSQTGHKREKKNIFTRTVWQEVSNLGREVSG